MSEATTRLLHTAAEMLGGEEALARHLNIGTLLMRAYLEQRRPLPDFLLLRTVDIVLDHVRRPATPPQVAAPAVEDVMPDLKARPA